MFKKLSILLLITFITGCAGIKFCDDKGRPPGCHPWDPATKNGGAVRS
jgi:hypothetical protein